jgi:Gluconolactonase
LSVKCNDKKDCKDGSDEKNCANCTTFECNIKGHSTCIEEIHICNKSVNCDDFSDEKLCGLNECKMLQNKCQQLCIDLKQGYKCACRPGYFLKDDRNCIHNCSDYQKHGCSQICVPASPNSNKSHICACATGYSLGVDGVSCKQNTTTQPYLVLANKKYLNTLSGLHEALPIYEIKFISERFIAIDFDWASRRFFWLENNQMLFSTMTKFHDKVLIKHIPKPVDLCVDWINSNIYFTESSTFSIFVIDLNSRQKKTILKSIVHQPNTIVCHPGSGYLYYSTRQNGTINATISSVGMDGNDSRVLVADLRNPQGLAIDYPAETLYWSDVDTKRIEYIQLKNPTIRHFLIHTPGASPSLTVFEDFLFFTILGPEGGVYKTHRWTGKTKISLKKSKAFEKFTDIMVNLFICYYYMIKK